MGLLKIFTKIKQLEADNKKMGSRLLQLGDPLGGQKMNERKQMIAGKKRK